MSIKDYIGIYSELIKTKQTLLLLYTAAFAYLITAWPDMINWIDFLFLILSIFLTISGTTALNMYIDRNIDAKMERTKNRPLPSGKVTATSVLINGIILTVIGTVITYLVFGVLMALLIFLGFFFDFVIYSILLKQRTRFSIIFGGISGGLPAMAGRIAVIQVVDLTSILFLIFILAWIPVHILTLALMPANLEGYREAGVPMWPVVRSKTETMRIIAVGAFLCAGVLLWVAHLLIVHAIIQLLIGLCCGALILLVIMDLFKPTQELTFKIFKFASMFMVLGFLLLFMGVVFA
ncbi:MAG: protoheme IX farnesyltransferase [archaeon]|nr:protoheme IX farnesyltransferase [archaeon]